MLDVLIQVEDEIIDLIKIKAELKGITPEEQARAMIAAAATLTPEEKEPWERADARDELGLPATRDSLLRRIAVAAPAPL